MFIKINGRIINLDKIFYIDLHKDNKITFWLENGGFIDIGVNVDKGINITKEQYDKIVSFLIQKTAEIF